MSWNAHLTNHPSLTNSFAEAKPSMRLPLERIEAIFLSIPFPSNATCTPLVLELRTSTTRSTWPRSLATERADPSIESSKMSLGTCRPVSWDLIYGAGRISFALMISSSCSVKWPHVPVLSRKLPPSELSQRISIAKVGGRDFVMS